MSNDYFKAQGWFKNYATSSEDSRGMFQQLVKDDEEDFRLASAESDKIKEEMNKQFGSGTIKYGSEIKQPEIKTPQAIFEFSQRNPAADGGRMGFSKGKGKFKSGESFKTVKEFKNVSGPGTGLGEENPTNIKKAKTALNKIKKQRNKKLFFNYKEGDAFWNNLMEDVDLSREKLSNLIKNTIAQEFPGAYVGDTGRKQHKIDTIVKSFLSHYDHNGSFDGNEKMAKILEQFHGGYNHKYETINNTFKDWVRGYRITNQGNKIPVEVEGVDRANLDPDLLKDLKKWKPNSKPQKNLMVQSELKFLNDLNSKGTYRNAPLNYEKVQQLYRDFMKKEFPNIENVDNRFFHRLNQLTELKQTGSYSTGNGNYSKIPGITGDKNRADWLKKGFGIQFQGNYTKIILKADRLLAEGNKAEANRLYKAADKFFGPDGIFTKAEGEGEHPFSRKWGKGKIGNELKINSLVKSDLNQFKRANFDIPVTQLFNEYKVADPKRQKEIAMEIEDRKKLMNYLTEGPNKKGIVEPVKFNYGKTSIGASVDVPDIDKIKNFDVQEFITRGEDYRGSFLTQGEQFNLVDKNKNIISNKIPDEEFRKMIKVIGCPNNKAGGGRIEFQDGLTCFDKGQKVINSAQVKSPAAQKNLAKLINGLAKTGTFVKNALKFGVVPEALFIGAESIIRAGGDQTLNEGFKSAIGFYTDWTGKTNLKADARASQNLRNIGLDGTINIEMLNEMRDASEQVKKLESNQKNVLSVYDESLMGESEQDYKKRSGKQIEDAKKYLSTKYLTDSQKNFYTSQENEAIDIAGTRSPFEKFLGEARNKSENMRYENDPTGMQSDMFTLDPMSAKAKKDSVKNLPLRNQLSGSPGETAFMNLSQLPKGPRQGSQIDDLVNASNAQFKAQGVDTRVNSSVLKAIQDTKKNFKNMTMEEMIQAGLPMEAILGFNQPEVIKPKPMYDYAEGGITTLRSKYEYKK